MDYTQKYTKFLDLESSSGDFLVSKKIKLY